MCGRGLFGVMESDHAGKREAFLRAGRFVWFFCLSGVSVYSACVDPVSHPATLEEISRRVEVLQECVKTGNADDRTLSALAWSLFQSGDLNGARERFQSLADGHGLSDWDAAGYALTLLDLDDRDGARRWAVRAATGPGRALGLYIEARALDAEGLSAESIAACGRVLAADAQFVEARLLRGTLYRQQGAFNEAWQEADRVLSVDPRHREARARLKEIEPRITRSPEEMIPRKKIADHRQVKTLPPRESGPVLRVGLGTDGRGRAIAIASATFQCAGPFSWVDDSGRVRLAGKGKEPWRVVARPDGVRLEGPTKKRVIKTRSVTLRPDRAEDTILVRDLAFATGFAWSGKADRELRGTVTVRLGATGGHVINNVPLELYLYGVLPAEMPARFPSEALKAQAVLARSYALFQRQVRRPHKAQGYDLCDEQHCQVYGGVALEHEKASQAVDATRGIALVYQGQPVHAVYSSNCGGHSQSGEEIGWGAVPYWRGVPDWTEGGKTAYCDPSAFTEPVKSRWVRLSFSDALEERIHRSKPIGSLLSLSVTKRGPSGRAVEVTALGSQGRWTVRKESDIRRLLGLAPLRSTLVTLYPVYRKGRPAYFLMEGRGWGHGVGFCQSGGAGRALAGQSFSDILAHYFPGTEITTFPLD